MFWGGIWRKRFIWTKEDGDSIILGPHRKLGSNLHSVDLSQKECTEANVRASTGQHINSTNPELESCKGTALAGFEPVTICFRDCFKMPRELGGREGGVQVKNHGVGLRPAPPLAEARVTQLATASFRDNSTVRSIEDHLQLSKVGSRCFPNWAWKMSHSFEWHPQHDALHRSRGVRAPRSPLNPCGTCMESTGNQQGIPVWLCTRKCSVLEALRASSKLSTGHSVKWGTMGPKSGWFLLGHGQNSDFGRNHPVDNACRKWHPGWD